jgi:hypothetical protein
MDTSLISIAILILLIYTLYWTYRHDFGLFLFIVILLLSGLFIYLFINEKIIYYENKINYYENKIENIINAQIKNIANIGNIGSNIANEQIQNLRNLKSNILG